jgi:hypothetical protein
MNKFIYVLLILVSFRGAAQSFNYDVTVSKIKSLIVEHYIIADKANVI